VSGVPVVDANGAIVGNISARDVRSMVNRPAVFERIYDTVTEFLSAIHDEAELKGGVDRAPAVCCRRTDTLVSILDKFITLGIHRVYVGMFNIHMI
jgi:CBS domain-containing protein